MDQLRAGLAAACLAAGGAALAPSRASAQAATVLVGGLRFDERGGTRVVPAYGVRVDHAVLPWLVAELGAEYAAIERYRADGPRPRGQPFSRYTTRRYAVDLQLQVQRPRGRARPYLGAGLGTAVYKSTPDASGTRARQVGTARNAAVGLRLELTRHLGVRGEVRALADQPALGRYPVSVQPMVGATWRW